MRAEDLKDGILRKDWSVLSWPFPQGSDQGLVGEITPLARHQDPEVRELALAVLNKLGGPGAREVLLSALHDPDEGIRARASVFLHGHCQAGDRVALEQELASNADEFVREHSALILGELGDAEAASMLRARQPLESAASTRQAMTLALARLQDEQALSAVELALRRPQPVQRVTALDYFRYVGHPQLVPTVISLLQDTRDALNAGLSHGPLYIRVCDVAVNALDAVLDHPFPFKPEHGRRYTDQELKRAAELAGAKTGAAHPAQ